MEKVRHKDYLNTHYLLKESIRSILLKLVQNFVRAYLHYNGANSSLFVNGTKIHKFTAKDSEIVPNNLCLGKVSKDFSASSMKKTGFNGHIYDFSVDCDAISADDILYIHKYLMKKKME